MDLKSWQLAVKVRLTQIRKVLKLISTLEEENTKLKSRNVSWKEQVL